MVVVRLRAGPKAAARRWVEVVCMLTRERREDERVDGFNGVSKTLESSLKASRCLALAGTSA
jgi:hypothetical protein